jgi:hypothetical protein
VLTLTDAEVERLRAIGERLNGGGSRYAAYQEITIMLREAQERQDEQRDADLDDLDAAQHAEQPGTAAAE